MVGNCFVPMGSTGPRSAEVRRAAVVASPTAISGTALTDLQVLTWENNHFVTVADAIIKRLCL